MAFHVRYDSAGNGAEIVGGHMAEDSFSFDPETVSGI